MPFDGTIEEVTYIPGKLWPVNRWAVPIVPNLFCQNERLVFRLSGSQSEQAYLVMVGALNVGRLCAADWPELLTNPFRQSLPVKRKRISRRKEPWR